MRASACILNVPFVSKSVSKLTEAYDRRFSLSSLTQQASHANAVLRRKQCDCSGVAASIVVLQLL
jgi:hypothetical protein